MKRRSFRTDAQDAGKPLERFLEQALEDGSARALITAGAVYVGGRRCLDPQRVLTAGSVVLVVLEESGQSVLAPALPPPPVSVLFEDDWLLAVDKPPGIAAQPTPGRVGESLLDAVSARLGSPAGLVHRLDFDTSGVVVFGKHREATSGLAAEFREGRARKQYLAVTGPGLPERGSIDLPISKDPSRPGRQRASRAANGVPALTEYERLTSGPARCVVKLRPQTGRTHQLRAHLTAIGFPILGDVLYGGLRELNGVPIPRCLLHAQRLELSHPRDGQAWEIEAPAPDDLARWL
jgi:23S rRNA pseudouridine1911/1915/1917 synthase